MEKDMIVIEADKDVLVFELTQDGFNCNLTVDSLGKTAVAEALIPLTELRRLEKMLLSPTKHGVFKWSAEGGRLELRWMDGGFCRACVWSKDGFANAESGAILFADLEPEEAVQVGKLLQRRPLDDVDAPPCFGLGSKEAL